MQKWILLEVLAVVVVVGGAGAWFFVHNANKAPEAPQAPFADGANPSTSGPAETTREYVDGNVLLGTDRKGTTPYLIGFNGRVVYTTTNDHDGMTSCVGECTQVWPPYIVKDMAALKNLKAGVVGKVGTLTRPNGSLQVTYNGKPLYFRAADSDGVGPSGDGTDGVWHLVNP